MSAVAGRLGRAVGFVVLAALCGCAVTPRPTESRAVQTGPDGRKGSAQATSRDLMASMVELEKRWGEDTAMEDLRALVWPPVGAAFTPSDETPPQEPPDVKVHTVVFLGPQRLDRDVAARYEFRRMLPISYLVEMADYYQMLDQKPEAIERGVEDLEEWALIVGDGAEKKTVNLLWVIKWRGEWWRL